MYEHSIQQATLRNLHRATEELDKTGEHWREVLRAALIAGTRAEDIATNGGITFDEVREFAETDYVTQYPGAHQIRLGHRNATHKV